MPKREHEKRGFTFAVLSFYLVELFTKFIAFFAILSQFLQFQKQTQKMNCYHRLNLGKKKLRESEITGCINGLILFGG